MEQTKEWLKQLREHPKSELPPYTAYSYKAHVKKSAKATTENQENINPNARYGGRSKPKTSRVKLAQTSPKAEPIQKSKFANNPKILIRADPNVPAYGHLYHIVAAKAVPERQNIENHVLLFC